MHDDPSTRPDPVTESTSEPLADASGGLGVALLQFAPVREREANLERLAGAARAAAVRGASLLVAPEYTAAFEAKLGPWMREAAEPPDGPFVEGLRRIAATTGLVVVAGMLEQAPDGNGAWNALVAVGPTGDLLAHSRKVHLYDAFGAGESEWLDAGEFDAERSTFELGGLVLGLQTCYDLRFPELSRGLIDAGATALVVPAEWVRGPLKELHWTTLLRARAIENVAYVLGVDQAPPVAVGRSVLIDPRGVDIAAVSGDEGLAIGWMRADAVADARRANPSVSLRRLCQPRG